MTVVLIGTLDTKGQEYGWLRDRLIGLGRDVLVIDTGTGEPGVSYPVDVPNDQVAASTRTRRPPWPRREPTCSSRTWA
ncbi:Tm-1-like ATP-binding domain-containing protein [Nonomuraea glycinis]|uniref:UPF0261 domain-containing protein n=1 Tax=Nonomuraea glycinis TaxID=2047744 RepID=A0A918A475_9ACTN|nr:Tm-1-like ATP-binding domain-containing protein [Nonomuraea glycinis]MCA2177892.1 Tm-1-like ATP-binding domain-containing protein [Nonomuraea glycinis]GGP06475.1 hypothetical protein GCM10012278_30240 [Nonomuraea glycinis]